MGEIQRYINHTDVQEEGGTHLMGEIQRGSSEDPPSDGPDYIQRPRIQTYTNRESDRHWEQGEPNVAQPNKDRGCDRLRSSTMRIVEFKLDRSVVGFESKNRRVGGTSPDITPPPRLIVPDEWSAS